MTRKYSNRATESYRRNRNVLSHQMLIPSPKLQCTKYTNSLNYYCINTQQLCWFSMLCSDLLDSLHCCISSIYAGKKTKQKKLDQTQLFPLISLLHHFYIQSLLQSFSVCSSSGEVNEINVQYNRTLFSHKSNFRYYSYQQNTYAYTRQDARLLVSVHRGIQTLHFSLSVNYLL